MDGWPNHGLEDDLRPRMAACLATGRPFALVTVSFADGGPRGVGAQMVVTETDSWGFVSGGCIEADVAIHARATLADGEPRNLVYGRGSPWIDTRLPCGGRLDLLVERIAADDPVIAAFVAAYDRRQAVRYLTDGRSRRCIGQDQARGGPWTVDHLYTPVQRLIVLGSDPIAVAIAALGLRLGWATVAIWPDGPDEPPAPEVRYRRDAPASAIPALAPGPSDAIAIATHDEDFDQRAILAALDTPAGFIGVLGARRRIPGRLRKLRALGVGELALARLRMPIGLPIGAATPWEIAVSVTAEVIAERRIGAKGMLKETRTA